VSAAACTANFHGDGGRMDDITKGMPSWLSWGGGAIAAIGAGAIYLRQYLSSAQVDRTANEANVATILRLQDELKAERERADALMKDREGMVARIAELGAEVKALRDQVETLTNMLSGHSKGAASAQAV